MTAKSKKESQDLSDMNWQESDDWKRDRIMSLKQRKKNQECDGYVRCHFHTVLSSNFLLHINFLTEGPYNLSLTCLIF